MKIFSFKFLLLISTIGVASEPVLVKSDHPSNFENSTFIRLMGQLNDGKIPYPFSNLLDSFGIGVRKDNVLLIPNGRSLVKKYADYKNPRIIADPFMNTQDDARDPEKWSKGLEKLGVESGDLYIGFAPNHKALEVISYNPKAGKYDFFVVENYEQGKTPKVVSNPALCLSCHQNEAPIFARVPWNEVLGDMARDISTGVPCSKSHFKNDLVDKIIKANPDRNTIEGIDLHNVNINSLCSVNSFDNSVRRASTRIREKEMCEMLCSKDDDQCKVNSLKLLLGNELSKNELKSFGDIDKKILNIQKKFITSVLPNRDPYTNVGFKVLQKHDEIIWTGDNKYLDKGENDLYDQTYYDSEVEQQKSSSELSTPIKDPQFFNPATPRPEQTDIKILKKVIPLFKTQKEKIYQLAKLCIDPFTAQSSFKKKNNFELISVAEQNAALQSQPVLSAFKTWPLTRDLLNTIKKQVNGEVDAQETCAPKKVSVVPVYAYQAIEKVIDKFNDDKIGRPKKLFNQYCVQCHGAGPSAFIRLPLESMPEMANYVPSFSTTAPLERLEKNNMPPQYVAQPTDSERTEMIKVLKELKNH